jgi:hypothetical protein
MPMPKKNDLNITKKSSQQLAGDAQDSELQ